MEKRKKVTQKPKNTLKFTIIVTSILKTLWAIGTSVAATGVLNPCSSGYTQSSQPLLPPSNRGNWHF